MSAKIVYGFKINQSVIQSHYNVNFKDENESLSERLSEFETELKETNDTSIVIVNIDFDHSSDDNKDGGECLIIGVVMNQGEYHYNGCMKVPKMTDNIKEKLAKYLEENPTLQKLKLEPDMYVLMAKDGY